MAPSERKGSQRPFQGSHRFLPIRDSVVTRGSIATTSLSGIQIKSLPAFMLAGICLDIRTRLSRAGDVLDSQVARTPHRASFWISAIAEKEAGILITVFCSFSVLRNIFPFWLELTLIQMLLTQGHGVLCCLTPPSPA